jgi:hypothetical protein
MRAIAPGSAHDRPSAQPPIDMSGDFSAQVSINSPRIISQLSHYLANIGPEVTEIKMNMLHRWFKEIYPKCNTFLETGGVKVTMQTNFCSCGWGSSDHVSET